MKLGVEEGNLAQVVRSTVESFLPLAREKALTVSVALDEPDLCGVFDREKIETVLYNLIANALKFTPRAGGIPSRCENCYSFREKSDGPRAFVQGIFSEKMKEK